MGVEESSARFHTLVNRLVGRGQDKHRSTSGILYSRARKERRVLDGEVIRKTLSSQLGFSKDDRDYHVRHLGFVSNLLSRNGVIAIVAAISPYRAIREEVRGWHGADRFVEVFLSCPIETLIHRDVRGFFIRLALGKTPKARQNF